MVSNNSDILCWKMKIENEQVFCNQFSVHSAVLAGEWVGKEKEVEALDTVINCYTHALSLTEVKLYTRESGLKTIKIKKEPGNFGFGISEYLPSVKKKFFGF